MVKATVLGTAGLRPRGFESHFQHFSNFNYMHHTQINSNIYGPYEKEVVAYIALILNAA